MNTEDKLAVACFVVIIFLLGSVVGNCAGDELIQCSKACGVGRFEFTERTRNPNGMDVPMSCKCINVKEEN